ncbi:Uncharacterised protein [Vibrio cholerae]|nr:Uncharacterised protein [Vibrio cholerae]CSA00067.1 Uncharacterised protein [Vibrio cholerae]CSA05228.1 Uncharacterised protein [Vibrio cholerae]CSC40375.1 Uncharacterised protein [Vibrio cholerae]CSC59394.1 Uncharacterised protein [Vibrio cholerae]
MDWVITNSPTKLIRLSTFSISTRIEETLESVFAGLLVADSLGLAMTGATVATGGSTAGKSTMATGST